MTCIVGIEHDGGVTIGGDSCITTGGTYSLSAEPKVFRVGELLLGMSGDVSALQAIRYGLAVPEWPEGMEIHAWMASRLRPALMAVTKAAALSQSNGGKETHSAWIIVGVRGQAWEVASDGAMTRSRNGYESIGSGYEVALGALAVATGTPEERALAALQAAEKHVPSVRGPFTVETLERAVT